MAVNMACVFWDSQGVILVDFMLSGYSECRLLQYTTLRPVTRPNLLRRGIILQHDNASSQKAHQTVEKVAMMGW